MRGDGLRAVALTVAVVLFWPATSAQARQHQHGGSPAATAPTRSHTERESPLNLGNVLKAADRSLAALEKAVRGGEVGGERGQTAAADYLNLVGWVERFFAGKEGGAPTPADVERARRALADHSRRIEALAAQTEKAGRGSPIELGQARAARAAALSAVDAAVAAPASEGHPAHDHDASH